MKKIKLTIEVPEDFFIPAFIGSMKGYFPKIKLIDIDLVFGETKSKNNPNDCKRLPEERIMRERRELCQKEYKTNKH